jgi:NodT family efflux transporter outer membrane factor (OMF) lipoprotein
MVASKAIIARHSPPSAGLLMKNRVLPLILWITTFSACATGPRYQKPSVEVPSSYRIANWAQAQPKDELHRGKWWELYNDPLLNSLEEKVNVSNQNIAASFASYQQACAVVREARSQYLPTLSLAPNVAAQGGQGVSGSQSNPGTYTQYSIPVNASWQPDIFGRVQNTIAQDIAAAQVSAADLENERLSMQATLASDYFELRGQDAMIALFNSTVSAYRESLKLNRALYQTGIASDETLAQAESQVETTDAQATNLIIARDQYQHAIAVLIGKPASNFTIAPVAFTATPPVVPVSVPSQLLERRPDIAAAERNMAEANAQIGIAVSAYFPSISLTGGAGFGSNSLAGLMSLPTFVWSLGATVSETIFDGGLRSATVDQYKSVFDQAVASYRQTVLTAFQQVEDAMTESKTLEKELNQQQAAISSTQRYLKIATDRYKLGIDPYLDVITAQVTLLTNKQTDVTLRMEQMTTSVQLIEAVGGGWNSFLLPTEKQLNEGSPKPQL